MICGSRRSLATYMPGTVSRILFDEDSPYYDEYDGAYYL